MNFDTISFSSSSSNKKKEKDLEKDNKKEIKKKDEEEDFNNLLFELDKNLINDSEYYKLISNNLKSFKNEIDEEMEKHEKLYEKIIPEQRKFSINLKRINKLTQLMNNIQPELEKSYNQIELLLGEQKGIIEKLDNLEKEIDKYIIKLNKKEEKNVIQERIINNRNEIDEIMNKINNNIENMDLESDYNFNEEMKNEKNLNDEIKNIFQNINSINVDEIKITKKIFAKNIEQFLNSEDI